MNVSDYASWAEEYARWAADYARVAADEAAKWLSARGCNP